MSSKQNENCTAHKQKSLYDILLPFHAGRQVTTISSLKRMRVPLCKSVDGASRLLLLFASSAMCKFTRFNYLVRLLKQQYELHAHGGQASTVGAVQAAVAQEHPQQWLVALQPVSPAPLAVARTSGLESNFFF